jgi:hypothetical protein
MTLADIIAVALGSPWNPTVKQTGVRPDYGLSTATGISPQQRSPYQRTLDPGETRSAGEVQDMLADVILAAGGVPGMASGQARMVPGARRRVVYHGTTRDFDKFSLEAPKTTGGGLNKYGVSVSADPRVASRYAMDFSYPTQHEGANVRRLAITPKKTLKLSAVEFERLQTLVGKLDRGEKLNEFQQIDVENMVQRVGGKPGMHPIEAIKSAGYEAIDKTAGRGGAEPETLVLNLSRIKPFARRK